MKKTKAEKGITLIALIITIIVLIILAVVTIRAVQDNGIIGYAKKAQKASIEAEEKDQIGLALSEWRIAKAQPNPPSFEDFLKGKFGEENVTAGGAEGEWLVTFPKSGNQYKVKEDGTIENSKGITLSKSNLTLTLSTGGPVTDQITATLHGIEGSANEIAWTSSTEATATIDPTTGATATVTAKAKGETTITATYGDYTATCQVTVEEEQNEQGIAKGDFVEYNVTYTDVYINKEYTAQNGWRYLGEDLDKPGNSLIISTGIPAKLDYHYNDIDTADDDNKWYVTDESTLNNFRSVLGSSYTFYTQGYTYYSLQASAGLYYNFDKIKFAYGTASKGDSLGYFTKISNNKSDKPYDSTNTVEVTGDNLFISQEAGAEATVRLLTLPEVNKALGRETIDSMTTITADEDKVGLYKLDQLKNVSVTDMSDYDYSSTGSYWLASPYPTTGSSSNLSYTRYDGWLAGSNSDAEDGVRPVVSLPSTALHPSAQ